MKKRYMLMCLAIATIISAGAQTPQLWGTASGYGYRGAGAVIRINTDGSGFATPHVCNCHGGGPSGNLNQSVSGLLYGMTSDGGLYGTGVIFSMDSTGGTYTELYNFAHDSLSGGYPDGSLIQASNGLLYGMTSQGGIYNEGVIFSFNPLTNTYHNLYNFQGGAIDGGRPDAGLLQANNGLLYGTAPYGGPDGDGVLFSYNINTSTYNALYYFGDSLNSGIYPFGTLIQAQDSLLYGMTLTGGGGNEGVIFSFNTTTSAYKTVFSFGTEGALNGYAGCGDLVQTPDGMLYGLMGTGGRQNLGGIFSYDLTTSTEQLLFSFDTEIVFDEYDQSIMKASNGSLYGMTYGVVSGWGSLFSYNLQTSTFNESYLFTATDSTGGSPLGGLMQATNGLLYGMTGIGGLGSRGVIFDYNPGNPAYQNLYFFADSAIPQGCELSTNMVHASNGLLYGTTGEGGQKADGIIYSLNPVDSVFSKVYDFTGDSGAYPNGFLMQASNGLLYGTTQAGGINNAGVIYSYNPQTSTYQSLYNFTKTDSINDGNRVSGIIQASDSLLYGMAFNGGANSDGLIFSFNPVSSTYRYLYSFTADSNSGYQPWGRLVQAGNGLLYGLTQNGGTYQKGVIFSFDPLALKFTNLYNFSDSANSGGQPSGSLIQASDSLLYGMATYGGDSAKGVIFSYNPQTSAYNNIYSFTGGQNSGAHPYFNNLMQASNGLLYGTVNSGGLYNTGVIFGFNPVSHTYTNLVSLPATAANYPVGDLLEIGFSDTSSPCTNVYSNISDTICNGDSLLFNGVYLHLTGSYNDSITLISGCDSIVTLNLVVNNLSYTSINDTVCESTVFKGNTITQSGIYYDTLQNVYGCDSIITLNLTVNQFIYKTVNPSICNGDTFYVGTTPYTQTGTYTDTLTNASGCDSVVTLNLTVSQFIYDSISRLICNGDTFYIGNAPYTQTGNYTDTITNASGCDSVVILNLTVNQPLTDSVFQTICSGDTFLGHTVSGIYTDTLFNAAADGCDSIIALTLTVTAAPYVSINPVCGHEEGPFLCDLFTTITSITSNIDSVTWQLNGTLIDSATTGTLSIEADSALITGLPRPIIYVPLGVPQVFCITGYNGCGQSTYCDTITIITEGITQIADNNDISIYPNPTSDQLYIKTQGIQPETITIYDVNGRTISTLPFQPDLDVHQLSSGVYLIEVKSNMGVARKRFVVLR